MTTNHSERNQ